MDNTLLYAVLALLAFVFLLVGLGAKLPVTDILKFLAANGREMTFIAAFALLLGFLFLLSQS